MEKLKKSPAEILKTVEIQKIEQECLNRVFTFLSTRDTTKTEHTDKISAMDIARTLQFLGCRPTRADVELIIWVSQSRIFKTELFYISRKKERGR